ncbi:MAG: phosphate/phosphite/phosphonate ABC transporter substrate-binding protein [Pseudoxanthomonas sp.]
MTAWAAIAQTATPSPAGQHVLVLGRISDDPRAHYDQLRPLLDYVVPRMRSVGITEGRVLMARDPQQMTAYLRSGRVDWVTETAGTAMQLQRRGGAHPLLLTERNGVSRYRTLFIARRGSGIHGLKDLVGRSIAFQSTASTSAYLVPAITLLQARLTPELMLSPRDRVSGGKVGYLFARSELNISTWVAKGIVDAGVLSNLDWDDDRRMPPSFRSELEVVYQTPDYPRALEMVRAGLAAPVRARLREVLMEASQDPEGQHALRRFFGTTRFMEIDPSTRQALEQLSAGSARVRDVLE